MSRKLFVGNMPYSTTEADLRDLFAEAGEVASVKVILDRDTGRPRGFGFVEMGDENGANQAIERLNGRDFQGRPLTVRVAEDRRPPGRPGFGGPGGGGGGGRGGRDRGGRDRW